MYAVEQTQNYKNGADNYILDLKVLWVSGKHEPVRACAVTKQTPTLGWLKTGSWQNSPCGE